MKYFLITFFLITSLFAKNPSLESMVSQMIMVGVGGSKVSDQWIQKLGEDIKKDRVGGVILFAKNIENPKELKKLTSYFNSIKTKEPLFIAIDQEGGKVQRLSSKNGFKKDYPSAYDIARFKSLDESYTIYKELADEIKQYGFNLNFGPVVDLNINPKSPAIGAMKRSYSLGEEIVISYSREFVNAHKKAGVHTVFKHFPGHGSAVADSHKALTDVSNSWEYKELKPYFEAIKYNQVDAIMVGHINLDKFDKKYPASLSKKMIKGLLRGQMKFDGVVFSDDMNMKAISDIYGFKESIILAINAGVDVLVYASYFTEKTTVLNEVRDIILKAVKSGKIKREEIVDSYKRVIRLKNDIN